jgi:O-antigen ligase
MQVKKDNINLLLILSPLVFVFGTFITNLYVVLVFLIIFALKKNDLRLYAHEKVLILFLIYIFLQSLYLKNYDALPRVLFMSLFSYIFISSKYFNLKLYKLKDYSFLFYFFLSLLFLFFLYYIIFQFDINLLNRFSGFFGNEKILGSFLSKFFILIFNLYLFSKNKKFTNKLFIFYTLSCLLFTIFSIERMALIIFILNVLLYLIFKKKYLSLFLIVSLMFIVMFTTYNLAPVIKKHFLTVLGDTGIFQSFSHKHSTTGIRNQYYLDNSQVYLELISPEDSFKTLNVTRKRLDDRSNNINQKNIIYFFDNFHGAIILNALDLLKNDYLLGVGIKEFRNLCKIKVLTINRVDYVLLCSTHPHNSYVEILVETGVVGLALIITFLLMFLIKIIKNFDNKSNISCSLFSLFLIIILPFQSTGSFFSSRYVFFYFITFILINLFITSDEQ